jgi:hypothetical protein
MARDISFMQYMRAHGNTPGPTQRPVLTGVFSGLIAGAPHLAILYLSGAVQSAARNFGVDVWMMLIASALMSVLAGILYALVFKRAANDVRGGWLFGMSFGFLLWIIGPVALWQAVTERPVAIGIAARGIFGAQVLYGLVLGLVFPHIHFLLQARLADVGGGEETTAADGDRGGDSHGSD